MNTTITIETIVHSDPKTVWEFWTTPEHIEQWMNASDDWECSKAVNDLKVDGRFSFTLAAKDQSSSFDFMGTYNDVEENKYLAYTLDDDRMVTVSFIPVEEGVRVVENFEMETENSEEMQRAGWQAMLDNFKLHVENNI